MKKLVLTALLLACFCSGSYGQDKNKKDDSAFKLSVGWGASIQNAGPEAQQQYLQILNSALTVVQLFQPKGDNFFVWNGDRKVLKGKTFTIYFTESNDEYLQQAFTTKGVSADKDMDAVTLLLGKKEGDINIYLCLFADKLFFDDSGKERTDSFARITVALAHEFYGNVQNFLEKDAATLKKGFNRRESEIRSFTRGIEFINKVIDSMTQSSGKLYSLTNRDKLLKDYKKALEYEKAGLRSWQKAPVDAK